MSHAGSGGGVRPCSSPAARERVGVRAASPPSPANRARPAAAHFNRRYQ
ncbi:hypothetical protein [Lysobacter gummosus]